MKLTDPIQKRLGEMERDNPSETSNRGVNLRDKLVFAHRVITGKVTKKLTETDFERARWDENYRQEFLNNVDLEEYSPFVGKVVYGENDFSKSINGRAVMTTKPISYSGKSLITVYASAFSRDESPTFADFYNTLVHHEGFHAVEQHESGSFKPLIRFLTSTREHLPEKFKNEVSAYSNQIFMGDIQGCSPSKMQDNRIMRNYYQDLVDYLKNQGGRGK